MDIKAVVRRYETRNKAAGTELSSSKSRVDWRRTKREFILFDSSDEFSVTYEEEEPTASEDEIDEKDETIFKNSLSDQEEKSHDGEVTEDGEDECIVPGKRKRLNPSVLYDSDESEDSDILVRKVCAKRHCIIDEGESSQEQQPGKTCPTENVSTNRKQKVFAKLKELARQRATRTSCSSESCEDSNGEAEVEEELLCPLSLTPTEGSETDSDSMKDFIVEEDEDADDDNTEHVKNENQPQQKEINKSSSELLAYYVPQLSRCDHYVHFKRIVNAFLINAIDDTFLSSLYDGTRQKKYAQDMLLSLHYLDDRFIQPRLENLISRSRWKDRFKERVDCYPNVHIIMKDPKNISCQACELNRYCKFNVLLSGKLYNSRTLETDDFMSDDKQRTFNRRLKILKRMHILKKGKPVVKKRRRRYIPFLCECEEFLNAADIPQVFPERKKVSEQVVLKVGMVCANRTRVYHNLKHFKYKLYVDCSSITKLDGIEDEPVRDTVKRLFNQLEDSGWIQKRYNDLEDCMNDADSFQEEKVD